MMNIQFGAFYKINFLPSRAAKLQLPPAYEQQIIKDFAAHSGDRYLPYPHTNASEASGNTPVGDTFYLVDSNHRELVQPTHFIHTEEELTAARSERADLIKAAEHVNKTIPINASITLDSAGNVVYSLELPTQKVSKKALAARSSV